MNCQMRIRKSLIYLSSQQTKYNSFDDYESIPVRINYSIGHSVVTGIDEYEASGGLGVIDSTSIRYAIADMINNGMIAFNAISSSPKYDDIEFNITRFKLGGNGNNEITVEYEVKCLPRDIAAVAVLRFWWFNPPHPLSDTLNCIIQYHAVNSKGENVRIDDEVGSFPMPEKFMPVTRGIIKK